MNNNHLKYIIFAGLFLVPFVPLIISSSLFFPFIVGKAFAFRLIVEIIFATWLILAIRDPEYRPKFSWISGAILIFTLAILLADILSENPFKSFWSNFERMEGFIGIIHFVALFFVAGSMLKTEEIWNKLLGTSLFASGIMAVYSFFQLAGKIVINQGGVRVDGTFGNASYLGIYMVFHIFFAGLLYFRSRIKWQKVLIALVALLDLVILYFTATRGAILGLLGGALISLIFLALKSEKGNKIRKIAVGIVVAILVFVGTFIALRNTDFVKNNKVLTRFASLSFSEIKTQGRYYVWPIAWKGFLERPIFGWGEESFNFVFNKYYNSNMYDQEPWFDRTHNIALDWLIAGGAVGFLSYLSIFVALLYYIWKAEDKFLSVTDKAVVLGLLSAYTFHNLFVFDQIGSYILFFTLLAYVHAHSPEASFSLWQKIASGARSIFTDEKGNPVTESVVVVLLALTVYFVVYSPWMENKAIMNVLSLGAQGQFGTVEDYAKPLRSGQGFSESLEHVSQAAIGVSMNPNAPQELKQELLPLISESFEKHIKNVPNDARYRLFYGLFLSRFGQFPQSNEQLKIASELSPNKQTIYFELVNNLLLQGNNTEAVTIAKKAYELQPNFGEAKFIYGIAMLLSGDKVGAQKLFSEFPPEKLVFDDRYISALATLNMWDEVLDVANRRVATDPNNIQYRINLAAAHLQSGRRAEAVKDIEAIIEINPEFKAQGEYYISEIKAGRNP